LTGAIPAAARTAAFQREPATTIATSASFARSEASSALSSKKIVPIVGLPPRLIS
jgi:hypothetical protein